jgi:hypothetical protein
MGKPGETKCLISVLCCVRCFSFFFLGFVLLYYDFVTMEDVIDQIIVYGGTDN